MIKYYGTPLTPKSVFIKALTRRNCLIPFPNPQDLKRGIEVCNKVIVDNGAFTIWRKGGSVNWDEYYDFVDTIIEDIEFFFIPDVIDGTEEENDFLISHCLWRTDYSKKGVPIWHINESLYRLEYLIEKFDYIAIGSAGEYKDLGTWKWHRRMDEAMKVLCNYDGFPKVKIHMLRCLNPKIFTRYPFHSGDSTGLAQNHSRDGWERIISRIEPFNSPLRYGELGGLFCA